MMCVFMTSSVILLNNSTSPDATCFIRISLAQLASKKKGWTPLCGEQWFSVCVNSNSSPIVLLYACIECFNLLKSLRIDELWLLSYLYNFQLAWLQC